MKYNVIVKVVFDRRKISSATKPGAVTVEIRYGKKDKRLSTGVSVLPSQWDATRLMVVRHTDSANLNIKISKVLDPVKKYVCECQIRGEEFAFAKLDDFLRGTNGRGQNFREYVETKTKSRTDIREVTKRNHNRLLNALDAFKRIQTFDDLTPRMIREFDKWLKAQGYVQTTVACYHKFLKNYIHLAMADELLATDPYAGIRIEKGKSKERKYLTDDELARVQKFRTEDPSTQRARDLFLFQCYTGLAYADMAKFDFGRIEKRDGKFVIRDVRQKTGEDYYIVLLSPALKILRKYKNKLPLVSNQKYNMALKAVAAGAGLKKTLTSHMGRHTFATYCLNHGISLETLAPMMGHSSIKSTQIYAKMINKTVESAFSQLEKTLK